MGGAGNMQSNGVGIGWNSNLICGDMSITTTLQNQINGITTGFQTIMSNVIQNATRAVASLPAQIIQPADPGLSTLLTKGILQARSEDRRVGHECVRTGRIRWSAIHQTKKQHNNNKRSHMRRT